MTPEQIKNLSNGQWIDTTPCALNGGDAYRLFMSGSEARYYLIYWLSNLPGGFTQFVFDAGNKPGQSELKIWKMNRQDTAMDTPGLIAFTEYVLVFGGDCSNFESVIMLD